MSDMKLLLEDSSFFRKCYICCLFLCNISFLQIFSYIALPFIFIWGALLMLKNEMRYRGFYNIKYGIWIITFILSTVLTSVYYLFDNFLFNILMIFHVAICFFIFYGLHNERNKNHKAELFSICKAIIYLTLVCGITGIVLLLCGVSFEFLWIKFIIYENRFTGVYINPNLLGFISVVSVFCCHIVSKEKFIQASGYKKLKTPLVAACIIINLISLFLCDSNSSLVFFVCYVLFSAFYKSISFEKYCFNKKTILKSIFITVSSVIIITSVFATRYFCQSGFSFLMVKAAEVTQDMTHQSVFDLDISQNLTTFTHENKNFDSGRIKLIKNSANLFLKYPILGVGRGNIIEYSKRYVEDGVLDYNLNFNDIHNGYITILISSGILGFSAFAIFGFKLGKNIIMTLLQKRETFKNTEVPCEASFLCAYLVFACFEKALLYDISIMVMLFWLILGHISCILRDQENEETALQAEQLLYQQQQCRERI